MDPFEARLQFIDILSRLSASQQSIVKASSFALRHREFAESLFSCLVDEMEQQQSSLNSRLNLFFVIDALVCQSNKSSSSNMDGGSEYLILVERDMGRIVELVVPRDSQMGASLNRPAVVKVLQKWRSKGVFPEPVCDLFMDQLPPAASVVADDQTLQENTVSSLNASSNKSGGGDDSGMTKQDILTRMEEDRERHKKQKEAKWMVDLTENERAEFAAVSANLSDLGEQDFE
eukprot:Partr_v1_DN25740_c0_g1_i1_m74839 putative Conserved hypothetical protein